ncbi:MAG: peptidoglycan-binding protein [Betaproteobacteria bacterium HGW-Betaproteobacteria-1]|jgi:peptidoglycan-associated lipoprotein|nr:MAG: peptidoglycan-binding protein [Betaproteobacteria bacterium HGW-Betaproteobacteria-1]
MNKGLIGTILLAVMLTACSSKPMKDAATVDDKSVSSAPAATVDDGAATSGAATSSMDVNPLKDPNNILSQRSIYFDFDKDDVKAEFRPLIEAHAKYLNQNSGASITLEGHADEIGTREYNLSLGQRRSVSVKKVMNLLGVQDSQIETVSYGEERATGTDSTSRAKDRRVDIIYKGE